MRRLILLLSLSLSATALADDTAVSLAKQLKVSPKDVAPAEVAGLYRVTLGPQILYVTGDGKYVLRGDLIRLSDGADLSADARDAARAAYIAGIGEQNMIIFGPPHPRHVVTVLTDIDCAYCRQLADEMPKLVQAGVEVRYLAFPRTGVDSPSWDKAISVWCARDPRIAYQLAMKGGAVTAPGPKCDARPVIAGYEFARKLGLDGTPVLFTEDGHLIDGYVPADQLVKILDRPDLLAAASD
ncbi:MAG TPA: DsbC family protein [Gammaproteobacteria bacterium]|nr:DsbC family protein [Gammaproteobacteria bacterium]